MTGLADLLKAQPRAQVRTNRHRLPVAMERPVPPRRSRPPRAQDKIRLNQLMRPRPRLTTVAILLLRAPRIQPARQRLSSPQSTLLTTRLRSITLRRLLPGTQRSAARW